MNEHDEQVISRNSRVTLGLSITVASAIIGAAGVTFGAYSWIRGEFEGLHIQLSLVQSKLELAADERWRQSNMEAWAYRFAIENPTINVPDPKSISDTLNPRRSHEEQ